MNKNRSAFRFSIEVIFYAVDFFFFLFFFRKVHLFLDYVRMDKSNSIGFLNEIRSIFNLQMTSYFSGSVNSKNSW